MDEPTVPDDEDFLKSLVRELLQEVQGLKDHISDLEIGSRLADLEDQITELSTEVRLQARRSNLAASQLHLNLGQLGSNSTSGSPRVAGPLSPATATPRGNSQSGHTAALASPRAAAGATESSHGTPRSFRDASKQPAGAPSSSPAGHAAAPSGLSTARSAGTGAGDTADGSASTPRQRSGTGAMGVFGTMKNWKEDVLDTSDQVLQAKQAAEQAAAAAADAAAVSNKCQQQVLELRGRQGQAERRLDTLWQLQEAAAENEATLLRLQQDLQQTQQQLMQQQHNMAAMQAQLHQLDSKSDSSANSTKQMQAYLDDLQQQMNNTHKEVLRVQEGLAQQLVAAAAAAAAMQQGLEQQGQKLQEQLNEQQKQLDRCSAEGRDALDKCEKLRQGAVVTDRRLDGVAAQIKDAVQPITQRVSALEAAAASVTAAAATCSTAVQQHQLTAALAQMSAAAVRQQEQLKAVLAGLAHRVETLEAEAARQERVVLQDDFQRQLQQLRSDIQVAVTQATGPLVGQLKAKADITALTSTASNLTVKLNNGEQQLLMGLKSVGDKSAALLQHKADAAAVDAWKQQMGDEVAKLRSGVQQVLELLSAQAAQHRSNSPRKSIAATNAGSVTETHAGPGSAVGLPVQAAAGSLTQRQQQEQPAAAQRTVAECAAAAAAALDSNSVVEAPESAAEAALGRSAVKAAGPAAQEQKTQPVPSPAAQPTTFAPATVAADDADEGINAMVLRPLTGAQHSSSKGGKGSLRPPSVQPWASTGSISGAADLHSAAQNAKVAKAARDKEAARQRVLHSRGLVAGLGRESVTPTPEEVAEALQQQLNVAGLRSPAAGRSGESVSIVHGTANAAAAIHAAAAAVEGTGTDSIDGVGGVGLAARGQAGSPLGARHLSAAAVSSSNKGKPGSLLRTASAAPVLDAAQSPAGKQVGGGAQEMSKQQLDRLPAVHAPSPTADDLRALLRTGSPAGSRAGSAVAALRMPALGSTSGQQMVTGGPTTSSLGHGSSPAS